MAMGSAEQERLADGMTRRGLLARGAAGGAVLGLPGFLAACGSASSGGGSSSGGSAAASTGVARPKSVPTAPPTPVFTPSPGTTIPTATVRIGLEPYADTSLSVIGMRKGYFSDVGIRI